MINQLKKNYLIIIYLFFFIYFSFNLLSGDRGVLSFIKKKTLFSELEKAENELNDKIKDLDLKISLLSDNIDLDFVEILIRDKFIYGKNGETLYIIKE